MVPLTAVRSYVGRARFVLQVVVRARHPRKHHRVIAFLAV